MEVRVKCFSIVRATFDAAEITVELSDRATAADLVRAVRERASGALDGIPLRVARNQSFVDDHDPLEGRDELALIPPVQGG